MQINDIIPMNARKDIKGMLLTPGNSTNPLFWGKHLNYSLDGKVIEPIRIQIPREFDFFNAWCGKDPIKAKEYYAH